MSYLGNNRGGQEINVEAIMDRIRADLGSEADRAAPSGSGDKSRSFSKEVYRDLKQAIVLGEASYGDYRVGHRTPIIGSVWAAVRVRIHREIRIYADAIVERQRGYNIHVARLLNRLVESIDGLGLKETATIVEAQQGEISSLRQQVAELQGRILAIENADSREYATVRDDSQDRDASGGRLSAK